MIIEGVVDSTLSGHISVDNVKIVPKMTAADCKGKPSWIIRLLDNNLLVSLHSPFYYYNSSLHCTDQPVSV